MYVCIYIYYIYIYAYIYKPHFILGNSLLFIMSCITAVRIMHYPWCDKRLWSSVFWGLSFRGPSF